MSSYQEHVGAHKDRSSKIEIYPEAGLLRKTRKNRSEKSIRNEFLALIAWNQVLTHYLPEKSNGFGAVQSPYAVSCDASKGEIVMTFCTGFGFLKAITLKRESQVDGLPLLPHDDVISEVAFSLGRLASIKDIETLAHGDYAPRHILYNPLDINSSRDPRMSLIDVESLKQGDRDQVRQENDSILKKYLSAFPGSDQKKTLSREAYYDGYSSIPSNSESIWGDAKYAALSEQ